MTELTKFWGTSVYGSRHEGLNLAHAYAARVLINNALIEAGKDERHAGQPVGRVDQKTMKLKPIGE